MGAVGDRLWFAMDRSVPSWDQAEYLTGALNYWRALQTPQWLSPDWWTSFWLLSAKIPPLVYVSTSPILGLFGAGFDQSTLVNLVYSAILLGAVYTLGVCLFSIPVGLWAAGLCLLMPGLYRVRLDYLMDYPLTAMVTLCFTCLTLWREYQPHPSSDRSPSFPISSITSPPSAPPSSPSPHYPITLPPTLLPWLLALSIGITLGLSFLVKEPALLFLLVPLLWVTVEALQKRAWGRLAQLFLAGVVSLLVFGPWYRTNWLVILTASKRATVDSAIAEGDPPLLSWEAWTFYLKVLPQMVSLPLLLVGLMGLLLFWRRSRVSSQGDGSADYAPKPYLYRQQVYCASRRSLGWLLLFWAGGYFLSCLNINKDVRYVVPYLPVVALMLAYGFTLLPRRWNWLRWAAVGLSTVLMIYNMVPGRPIGLHNLVTYHPVYRGATYPHAEVVAEVIKTEPLLRSTIGVLPSTPEVNQHNINYYGNVQNFQVYGRQVGVKLNQILQDGRSLPWFLTKTGNQGSIGRPDAQATLTQWVENIGEFRLQRQWELPDSSTLKLFRAQVPLLEVNPAISEGAGKVSGNQSPAPSPVLPDLQLDQVLLPDEAPPGQPVPVTYRWSGSWDTLQSGLVLLTWHRQGEPPNRTTNRWLHDHAIALGNLHTTQRNPIAPAARYQVVERMAMLPPPTTAAGSYVLEAVYLNRKTGRTGVIALPPIQFRIRTGANPAPAPELDWVSQLRSLAATLPLGVPALDHLFAEIGRINQYDPVQDYLEQARQSVEWRLRQEPNNRDFAYALALTQVLKRRVNSAIAALETVTRLDANNANAYAYLAFVNLYDFHPQAAQAALKRAFQLNPNLPELHALNGVAALMQGNVVKAWNEVKIFQASQQKPGKEHQSKK
jgi:4-amino-4-deoxy-L-arabinose transferase-like glycosyltransferase